MNKTKIAIPVAMLVLAMLFTSAFNFSTTFAQSVPPTTPATIISQHFDAAQIYQTNNMTVLDPNIRNLAIIIPDSIGTNRSSLMWPTFLPNNATIAAGMRVIWFNADVNATHSIVVRNSTGATLLNSTNIPYQNATVYRFNRTGLYTFSDPSVSGLKNGTINVVRPTSFNASAFTNSSGTAGLFAIPATGKTSFDLHMNKLGFNAVATFNFTAFPSNSTAAQSSIAGTPSANSTTPKILYVWTQQTSVIHTAITRIANKARLMESILYPNNTVKMP